MTRAIGISWRFITGSIQRRNSVTGYARNAFRDFIRTYTKRLYPLHGPNREFPLLFVRLYSKPKDWLSGPEPILDWKVRFIGSVDAFLELTCPPQKSLPSVWSAIFAKRHRNNNGSRYRSSWLPFFLCAPVTPALP